MSKAIEPDVSPVKDKGDKGDQWVLALAVAILALFGYIVGRAMGYDRGYAAGQLATRQAAREAGAGQWVSLGNTRQWCWAADLRRLRQEPALESTQEADHD